MYGLQISYETLWVCIGLFGQSLFFMRFLFQWVASEKAGKSIIPHVFWYLSVGGSLVILSYAIWRQDPVFILGQSTGLFIYLRNIALIRRSTNKESARAA